MRVPAVREREGADLRGAVGPGGQGRPEGRGLQVRHVEPGQLLFIYFTID